MASTDAVASLTQAIKDGQQQIRKLRHYLKKAEARLTNATNRMADMEEQLSALLTAERPKTDKAQDPPQELTESLKKTEDELIDSTDWMVDMEEQLYELSMAESQETDGAQQSIMFPPRVVKKMRSLVDDMQKQYGMSDRVKAAFLAVDRIRFVDSEQVVSERERKVKAYRNYDLAFYLYRPSWSVAVVNLLAPVLREGSRVLVLGSSPGYEVAILSRLVGKSGAVITQDWACDHSKVAENLRADNPNGRLPRSFTVRKLESMNRMVPLGPYNAILDKFQWRRSNEGLDRKVYVEHLAPNGIVVYLDHKRSSAHFAAFRKTSSGETEDIDYHIPRAWIHEDESESEED